MGGSSLWSRLVIIYWSKTHTLQKKNTEPLTVASKELGLEVLRKLHISRMFKYRQHHKGKGTAYPRTDHEGPEGMDHTMQCVLYEIG